MFTARIIIKNSKKKGTALLKKMGLELFRRSMVAAIIMDENRPHSKTYQGREASQSEEISFQI